MNAPANTTMNRRNFLGFAGSAAALSLFNPDHAFAKAAQTIQREAFGGYLPLVGLRGNDLPLVTANVIGTLPTALEGALFRNGPALFERGGQRYEHPFDGDGMVQAWRFVNGKASFQGKFVRTAKFNEEQREGKFVRATFGSRIPNMRPTRLPSEVNTANTSVIQQGDKLLAMWEGGEATELDPATLETRRLATWRDDLKQMPFSAHPKLSPDGTLWNIGYMGSKVVLYEIDSAAKLKRCELLKLPEALVAGLPMMHDFAITQNYIVLIAPPMSMDMEAIRKGTPFGIASKWDTTGSLKFIVIDKATLGKVEVFEAPAAMVFHVGNAYEQGSDIVIDYAQFGSVSVMNEWMPKVMRDEVIAESDLPNSVPAQARLIRAGDAKGKVKLNLMNDFVEFPRVDPRTVGNTNRYSFMPTTASARGKDTAARRTKPWGFDAIMKLDWKTGNVDRFNYDDHYVVDEHVFVPRSASAPEGDGWLLGGYFDMKTKRSGLMVLDSARLANGPVARLELPYWTPTVFHGNYHAA
jgi:all-trans-8'-apo-beta-carotenal 15,15'-oxygenase